MIAAPSGARASLAHQPDIPPTGAASKVTPSGAATPSMNWLNGPRPAIPSTLPFTGATIDRRAATAAESSCLSGWVTEVMGSPVGHIHGRVAGSTLEIRKITLTPLGRLRTSVSH